MTELISARITHSWIGSEDKSVLSGRAIFRIGTHIVDIHLQSFSDFFDICDLLNEARNSGAEQYKAKVQQAIEQLK